MCVCKIHTPAITYITALALQFSQIYVKYLHYVCSLNLQILIWLIKELARASFPRKYLHYVCSLNLQILIWLIKELARASFPSNYLIFINLHYLEHFLHRCLYHQLCTYSSSSNTSPALTLETFIIDIIVTFLYMLLSLIIPNLQPPLFLFNC